MIGVHFIREYYFNISTSNCLIQCVTYQLFEIYKQFLSENTGFVAL